MKVGSVICRDDGPKAIFYHDMGMAHTHMGTPVELFKAHIMAAKRNGYEFLPSLEALAEVDGRKKLLLCFDDGFRGVWEERAYLIGEGLRPIVFLAVDLVGKPGYLTWDEILTLQQQGFTFQGHTWSHQTLCGDFIAASPKEERSEAWFDRELRQSRAVLTERLGRPVESLCFPAGHFSQDVIRRCKEAGYTTLYTSLPGKWHSLDRWGGLAQEGRVKTMVLPRHLCQSYSLAEFKLVLKGALGVLAKHYLRQHFSKT